MLVLPTPQRSKNLHLSNLQQHYIITEKRRSKSELDAIEVKVACPEVYFAMRSGWTWRDQKQQYQTWWKKGAGQPPEKDANTPILPPRSTHTTPRTPPPFPSEPHVGELVNVAQVVDADVTDKGDVVLAVAARVGHVATGRAAEKLPRLRRRVRPVQLRHVRQRVEPAPTRVGDAGYNGKGGDQICWRHMLATTAPTAANRPPRQAYATLLRSYSTKSSLKVDPHRMPSVSKE